MTSTPKRYQTTEGVNVGGWAYDDEQQTRFAFICSAEGFGLPAFDAFIDAQPEGGYRLELLDWRAKAFAAHQSGNRAALRGWLQAAWTSWTATLTHDHIRPTLTRGYTFETSKRGRSALYGLAAEILAEHGARYPAKKVLAVLKSLAGEDHPIIQHIDDDNSIEWQDGKGNVHTTTFHTFQSQLSDIRKRLR